MLRTKVFSMLFSLVAASGFATSALAQESTGETGYLERLKACQTITTDAERLACYDTAVGAVVAASDEGEVQIVDSEEVKKTRRGLFGFSLPKIGLFSGDDDDSKRLQSVITSVSISGSDTLFFSIEEGGAVWRIRDAPARTLRAKPGDSVVFKKASLGTYFIRINGQTGVKGKRVR